MNPEDIHAHDEAVTNIREVFVPMLKSFHDACLTEGFDEDQAFILTMEYMKITLGPRNDEV